MRSPLLIANELVPTLFENGMKKQKQYMQPALHHVCHLDGDILLVKPKEHMCTCVHTYSVESYRCSCHRFCCICHCIIIVPIRRRVLEKWH